MIPCVFNIKSLLCEIKFFIWKILESGESLSYKIAKGGSLEEKLLYYTHYKHLNSDNGDP